MPECQERILSENYADFIVEIGFQEEQTKSEFQDFCLQETGYKYDIIYAPLTAVRPDHSGKIPILLLFRSSSG